MDSARIMRWKPLSTTILDDYPNRHSPTDSADETESKALLCEMCSFQRDSGRIKLKDVEPVNPPVVPRKRCKESIHGVLSNAA